MLNKLNELEKLSDGIFMYSQSAKEIESYIKKNNDATCGLHVNTSEKLEDVINYLEKNDIEFRLIFLNKKWLIALNSATAEYYLQN